MLYCMLLCTGLLALFSVSFTVELMAVQGKVCKCGTRIISNLLPTSNTQYRQLGAEEEQGHG